MCGRFSFVTLKEKIENQFDIIAPSNMGLSYNIGPTQQAFIISNEAPRKLQNMIWGLIPYWSKDGTNSGKLINARKEGISVKPSFRMPIRERRCLVIADSFYEWKRLGQRKLPYRILLKTEELMVFAGVWDIWTDNHRIIKSFSIITTPANNDLGKIHNRMPVILSTKSAQKKWLSNIALSESLDLLISLKDESLNLYRVTEKINSVKYNALDLHKEVPELPSLF